VPFFAPHAALLCPNAPPSQVRDVARPRLPRKELDGQLPSVFEVYVGSSGGMSYGVWWDGSHLIYESFSREYTDWQQSIISPSRIQWRRFWQSMDRIGVWEWGQRHEPAGRFEPPSVVRVGVHWSLTLGHASQQASSSGDSAGPGAADLDGDSTFALFLEAVSRLLGGRAFA